MNAHLENKCIGIVYSSKQNGGIYDVPVLPALSTMHPFNQLLPYNSQELLASIWIAKYPS